MLLPHSLRAISVKFPTALIPALIVLSATCLLGGCSKEGAVTFNSGGMTHTFAEGKDATPKDFILPIYPGATTTGSVSAEGTDQEESKFLMLSTSDTLD